MKAIDSRSSDEISMQQKHGERLRSFHLSDCRSSKGKMSSLVSGVVQRV